MSRAGGNIVDMVQEMGLYEREVIIYSHVIEHFRHILSQQGKQVRPSEKKCSQDTTQHGTGETVNALTVQKEASFSHGGSVRASVN